MKKGVYASVILIFIALAILVYAESIGRTLSILIICMGLIFVSVCLVMEFREALNRLGKKSKRLQKDELMQLKEFEDRYKKKRQADIIKVLNFNEQIITNYLLTHNNYTFVDLLKKSTGMPKRNLRKALSTLKTKNIIEFEEKGDVCKVKLTRWFLSK